MLDETRITDACKASHEQAFCTRSNWRHYLPVGNESFENFDAR